MPRIRKSCTKLTRPQHPKLTRSSASRVMPRQMFRGSPEDLARLIAALAAGGPLPQPGEVSEDGWEEAARSGAAPPEAGPGGAGSLLLLSIPGLGIVGAALAPNNQDADQLPPGLLVPGDQGQAGEGGGFGYAMRTAMEQMVRLMMERSIQEQQPSVPPANESMRDALPRIVVTKEDQLDDVNFKCTVCFEEFKAGMRATRMFCGHLFCTNCIREWLRTANSCPICRFELATDSQEYEEGRMQRMRGRMARLKGGELRMMRVPELKRLMRALGVSGEGCVEKADLIRQLGAAPGVELTQDRKDIFYDESELQSLEMPLLRSLMERHCMKPPTGDMDETEERAAVLDCFAAAGWISGRQEPRPSEATAGDSGSVCQIQCRQPAPVDTPRPCAGPSDPRGPSSSAHITAGRAEAPPFGAAAQRVATPGGASNPEPRARRPTRRRSLPGGSGGRGAAGVAAITAGDASMAAPALATGAMATAAATALAAAAPLRPASAPARGRSSPWRSGEPEPPAPRHLPLTRREAQQQR